MISQEKGPAVNRAEVVSRAAAGATDATIVPQNGRNGATDFLRAALEWLAGQGARFALVEAGGKKPLGAGWQNQPHDLAAAMKHARRGGNIGLLCGQPSGGIIAIDVDRDYEMVVEALGPFADTVRVVRDNAPGRGKLLYRVQATTPSQAWTPAGWKPAEGEKRSPWAELLSDGRHALVPPSTYDGGHYVLRGQEYGIADLNEEELAFVWYKITDGRPGLPEPTQEDNQGRDPGRDDDNQYDDARRMVLEAWTTLDVFRHHGRADRVVEERGGELRLPGNGGLLIKPNGEGWYCFTDQTGGGDAVSAWAWCTGRKLPVNGREFWTVLEEMAQARGLELPKRQRRPSQATRTAPTWTPPEGEVTDVLLKAGRHDEGNARCVLALNPGRFLYSNALGWLYYDGTRWTREGAEQRLERGIVETLEARITAAVQAGAEDNEKLIKACIPNQGRVRGAKFLLQSLVSLPDVSELDAEPDLLNVPNGVVDLRTGQLLERETGALFTHCAGVDYDPGADSSEWVSWLTETVGQETADWLQMAVGYSLTGHTREEVLFYLWGPPRAGKGLFAETLLSLLGKPLAVTVNFATFTAQRTGDSQNFDLAPLRPARLVVASESNAYERFNEAKVKALTGGDEIYCAFKHRDHFNYRPRFKIWLLSNQPVNADPDDEAVWSRVRLVVFPHSYLGREDKTLKDRFKRPEFLRGVLAWAVAGAVRWYNLGPGGLPETQASQEVKAAHRRELDHVGAWLEECTEDALGTFTPGEELYASYREWCHANGVEPKRVKAFSEALSRKGFPRDLRRYKGRVKRGFLNLRLAHD